MPTVPSILALTGPKCLPRFGAPSWKPWRTAFKVMEALPMDEEELALFRQCTGRDRYFAQPVREAYFQVGRRGGKGQTAALWAVKLAPFGKYEDILAPGEIGTVLVCAADKDQAGIVFRYVKALVSGVPDLAEMVVRDTLDTLEFSNSTQIVVRKADFRTVRGLTLVGAIVDELAFLRDETSANPDTELLAALRPGLLTTGGPLICISTPYARRGALWSAYKVHYGNDKSRVLFWKAPTLVMNPTADMDAIEEEYQKDSAAASAEYGAEFRTDVTAFISDELLERVVVVGRYELAPVAGTTYVGFVDPSGGSQDSMTMAVAHRDGERVVLDCTREAVPPLSPEKVVEEFTAVFKSYGITTKIKGDAYGGLWPREAFAKHGIVYEVSDKTKSEIYLAVLPMLTSGRVELLDQKRLLAQARDLDRKTSRSGKDSVDHGPRGRDDVINAAAGALVAAGGPPKKSFGIVQAMPSRQFAQNRGLQEAVSNLRGRGGDDREGWANFLRGDRRKMVDLREV